MANDAVIKVGFESEVKDFIKEIKKELSSVKEWGLSDSLKDEISDIEAMLTGLSKSFSDGMTSKLDTKSFAVFERKITAEVQAIDKRVNVLEDSMQGLVTTLDSADSGKFTNFLKNIGSLMDVLKDDTNTTVAAIKELVNLSSQSGGKIQLVDTGDLDALDDELKMLEKIQKIKSDLDNDTNIGTKKLSTNLGKALKTTVNTYEKLISAQEELNKAKAEFADDGKITKLQAQYAEIYSDLAGMRDQLETFGDLDEVPKEIFAALRDGVDVIDEFGKRAVDRIEAVQRARANLGKASALSMDKEKSTLRVPMEIGTTGKGLATKAMSVIKVAQNAIKDEPLKVEFTLVSKYSYRKTNEMLKEWQESIGKIDDTELREKFEGLYQTIAKDFQKEIKIRVSSNVYDEEQKVLQTVEKIKELVGNKVHIFPQFDIQDVDVVKLQKKLDKLAKQLKLNISNLQLDKKDQDTSDKKLEALTALSETLTTKLDNLNKNYLAPIKNSLADILQLAQTLNNVADQTDTPLDGIINAIKEMTVVMQKAFGIFTQEDLDGIFSKMQSSIAGINGSLRGGDKNNLVVQLKEILALYKQYKDLGGTKELSDLGGATNVQKWLANHANDEISPADPFVVEGKNNAAGYAEGIRAGIPGVRAAAREMTEAALDEIRKTQDSHSPAGETEIEGKNNAAGFAKGETEGLEENLNELKRVVAERQKEVDKVLEQQKPLDDLMNKMLSQNQKDLGLGSLRKTDEEVKEISGSTEKLVDSMQEVSQETVEAGSRFKEYCDEVALGLERIARAKTLEKAGLMQGTAFDSDRLGDASARGVAYDLVSASDELWKEVVDKGLVQEGSQKFNELREFLSQYIKTFLSQFNLTVDEIKQQLVEIQNFDSSEVGFKPHNKNNNASGSWQHYHSIGKNGRANDKFEGDYTYKTYARFADPRQLNQANIVSIMKALSAAGFRGQVKVPGTGGVDRFSSSSDQLVIHGINSKMQKIAYEILQNQFGTLFSSLKAGFDKTKTSEWDGASFSEIVINKGRDQIVEESKKVLQAQQSEIKATQENIEETTKQAKINENLVQSQQKVVSSAEETRDALNKMAEAFVSDGKVNKVIDPVTSKNWGSLNRARKNPNREDREAAQNIQDFVGMYMKTGQTEMLSVIRDYIDSSNLKDSLKKSLHRTFTEAIEEAEKLATATAKEKPQYQTQVMTAKQYKEYLKKYATWKDSDDFNYNFKVQTEAMQKDGRAFRTQSKSGRWSAWQYKVDVPINQLDKLEQKEKEVEEQSKKTDDALSNVGSKVSPSLQKHIDKYQSLYKEQQNLLTSLSSMATAGGNIKDSKQYAVLKSNYDSNSRQMQKEQERVYKNFGVNLRDLALKHLEVANAAQTQAKAETQVSNAEEKSADTTISKRLQQKIDKYKELQTRLNELYSNMSPKEGQTNVDITAYGQMKEDARKIEMQMQSMIDKVFKNYQRDLRALAEGHLEVANAARVQASAEGQVAQVEETVAQSNISASLQKKIDKYKELQVRLNELYTNMSIMAQQPNVDTDAYKQMGSEARAIGLQMQKLSERVFKNYGRNLKSLADGHMEVANAAKAQVSAEGQIESTTATTQAANETQRAADAIKNEASEAQKGTKKKEKLAKAEKKLASASGEAADETDKTAKAIEKEYKKAEKARDKVIQFENDTRKAIADAPRIEQENLSKRLQKVSDEFDKPKFGKNFTKSFKNQIDEIKQDIKNLLNSGNIKTDDVDAIEERLKKLKNEAEETKNILADDNSITGLSAKIAGFMDQNTAMSRKFKKELKELIDELNSGGEITKERFKEIVSSFNRVSTEVKRLHQTGSSFFNSFLKQLKSANAQLIATYFSFQDFVRYAREGFQTVVEVDSALTELRKVSDASDERLAQSFKKSTETAKELGATISDVIGVTADWARLNNLGLTHSNMCYNKFSQNGETPEEDNPVGNYMICF